MKYEIKNLTKNFIINGRTHEVIRNLNLSGDTDEITVILGKSGCGKTTLLKILCGLESHDSGELIFPKGKNLSMVFQEPRLMPWLNTFKNITLGLEKSDIDKNKILSLIELVGLKGFEEAFPSQLSGGMQHRAALARALACEPEMILMDEPFSALDYFTRAAMQKELLLIHEKTRMGGIFVTHNIDEALLLGDHICIMADGKISHEIFREPSEGMRDLLDEKTIALKQTILSEFERTIQ